jgi:replication factor A1
MRNSWSRTSWRGQPHNSRDLGSLAYLVYLSKEHGINPYELLNSLIEIEKKNEVKCGPLNILVRERVKDHATFLLTRESKVIAQFSLRSKLWKDSVKTNRLYSKLVNRVQPLIKSVKPPSSIKELRKGMRNVDLRVKVTSKSEVNRMYSRYSGKPFRFCAATVTDPSGSIRLPLWNDQIDSISVGDEIDIKKAYVTSFRGLLQIVPSRKKGELIIAESSKPSITR